nr:hypothetical protein Iba_chr11fCG7570 [Ipomoea batatas]
MLSWSIISKAFMSSSLVSLSPIFAVIMYTNSSKSIAPLPSLSTSAIICSICSSVISNPRALQQINYGKY